MPQIIRVFVSLFLSIHLVGTCTSSVAAQPPTGAFSSLPTALMEDPRRIEWQKPDKIMAYLPIKPGDTIADIGAGTGYFSMLFAKKTGKDGIVYALEIDELLVKSLTLRTQKAGLGNIKSILASPTNPTLTKSSTDLIFLCDTHVFIENRNTYFALLRDSLKPDGKLAIISFNMKPEIPGAPPRPIRISREQTIFETEQAGFVLDAEYFFLPYQYFLIFSKR